MFTRHEKNLENSLDFILYLYILLYYLLIQVIFTGSYYLSY